MSAVSTSREGLFVAALSERQRPVCLGASIGHPRGTRGTLGPFVVTANGKAGFLSTASILAPQGWRPGDHIHQPSPRDGHTLTGATRIAVLTEMVSSPQPNLISGPDAAVAELLYPDDCIGNVVPPGCPDAGARIESVAKADEVLLNSEVVCVGRTSGFSLGRISSVSRQVSVGGEHSKYTFKDCIEVCGEDGPFSLPGDGGALVYTRSGRLALGMIFAGTAPNSGDRMLAFVTPLGPVLQLFGLTLR